ncbi:MAG: porin family protein [Bacteroidota bacterium]
MKRIAVTLLFIAAASFNSFAQKGFHAGLGGNFSTTWIINQNSYGADEYDYTLKTGGGFGLITGYNITDHIGFQVEFRTASGGQSYEDSHSDRLGNTRDYSLKYTKIPVLFQFIGGSSTVKFYANAGVQFGILNKATISVHNEVPAVYDLTVDAMDRYNKSDMALSFGLGTNITIIKTIYLSAGLGFDYSFSDINNGSSTAAGTFTDAQGVSQGWHWPDEHGSGIYKASKNATGGIFIGAHYLFSKGD